MGREHGSSLELSGQASLGDSVSPGEKHIPTPETASTSLSLGSQSWDPVHFVYLNSPVPQGQRDGNQSG